MTKREICLVLWGALFCLSLEQIVILAAGPNLLRGFAAAGTIGLLALSAIGIPEAGGQ